MVYSVVNCMQFIYYTLIHSMLICYMLYQCSAVISYAYNLYIPTILVGFKRDL